MSTAGPMAGRIKFQVWSDSQSRWRTVYVRTDLLRANVLALRALGFKFRIGGDRAGL